MRARWWVPGLAVLGIALGAAPAAAWERPGLSTPRGYLMPPSRGALMPPAGSDAPAPPRGWHQPRGYDRRGQVPHGHRFHGYQPYGHHPYGYRPHAWHPGMAQPRQRPGFDQRQPPQARGVPALPPLR